MSLRRTMLLIVSFTALSVFAGIAYVNDLSPYDNTIEDSFWSTTSHPTRSVQTEAGEISNDFNSKACSTVCVDLESFSSRAPGLIFIVR